MAREDDDLLPKKKTVTAKPKGTAATGISPGMRSLMRIARAIGILVGGGVALVGFMSVVGFVVESFWVRFAVAFLVVVGLPAFVSDRFLKKTNLGGGPGMVADVFAIILLGAALTLVTVDVASKPLLVREGDRYARSGSKAMARLVYFLGGVAPSFASEKPAEAAPAASASIRPDGGAR